MGEPLRITLAGVEYAIPPLNLRQHREIDLANLQPLPPKNDLQAQRKDSYERTVKIVLIALSAAHPDVTAKLFDETAGLDLTQLGVAYTAIEKFAGFMVTEDEASGEAQPAAEAAAA